MDSHQHLLVEFTPIYNVTYLSCLTDQLITRCVMVNHSPSYIIGNEVRARLITRRLSVTSSPATLNLSGLVEASSQKTNTEAQIGGRKGGLGVLSSCMYNVHKYSE